MAKRIIGRNEYVSLPELQLFDIDAKIDTGAYSSAIHCDDIQLDEAGSTVHFRLLDESHPSYHEHLISMPIHKMRQVKSSNGTVQKRVFIKTLLRLGDETYSATLSLTDRKSMKFPMLIGRTFLRGRFIVDVALQYHADNEGSAQ